MIIKIKVPKKAYFYCLFSVFIFLQGCGSSSEQGVISAALNDSRIDWKSHTSKNFILFAPEGSYASGKLEFLAKEAEAARQLVMERMQVVKQEAPALLLFLESEEEMESITGFALEGKAVVKENGILYVFKRSGHLSLQHEMGHLYSRRSWGPPAAFWLSEGVAVYAAGDCAGDDLHAWAAKLAVENKLADFDQLEKDAQFSKPEPHLQAGSFVKYIMEKYGVRSFRLLWEKGLRATSEATGLELDMLLENWTTHIMQNEFTAAAQFLDFVEGIRCK